MPTKDELLHRLAAGGQQHVLDDWDRLDPAGRAALAEQIARIDLALIERLHRGRGDRSNFLELAQRAGSPPAVRLDEGKNRFSADEARRRGAEALAAGQVGAMLVAGGQGTRLGFPHPKGMFPVGPISGKTLFQIHVEKLLAMGRRYGVNIPLYLMTSPATHKETVEFFARHDRFGLREDDLVVFCQGTMPAVDAESGRLLLEAPGRIATSPDGHGGMLAAMASSGAIEHARRRGIGQLFYFQVDNPMVEVCGEKYLGQHLLAGSEMTTQVVAKQDPLEKVGNVVAVDDRLMVIEYSDLPEEAARGRNADGSLAIWAGSIAVHVIDVAFLERMARKSDALHFHLAYKKVPYVEAGRLIDPKSPNAIKFERFIFDLIPSAANALVIEVDPPRAFAPLKNAPGAAQDTPEWVKQHLVALHREWLEQAGATVASGVTVEISPLFAVDADDLKGKLPAGTKVTEPTYFR